MTFEEWRIKYWRTDVPTEIKFSSAYAAGVEASSARIAELEKEVLRQKANATVDADEVSEMAKRIAELEAENSEIRNCRVRDAVEMAAMQKQVVELEKCGHIQLFTEQKNRIAELETMIDNLTADVYAAQEAEGLARAELEADCKAMAEEICRLHQNTCLHCPDTEENENGCPHWMHRENCCACPACLIAAKYREGA